MLVRIHCEPVPLLFFFLSFLTAQMCELEGFATDPKLSILDQLSVREILRKGKKAGCTVGVCQVATW
jgi:hypothetical protein